jgi:Domain of unknown function (DUF1905)/Bacteriocin-protection, YdeI or OmpD-Associated
MISFATILLKFDSQGEKTGWTYIEVPADIAEQLLPGNKKSFRVKGKLDNFKINKIALLPMGGGAFIMAVNAAMRKGIGKRKGAIVKVQIELDKEEIQVPSDLEECLNDEPAALNFFNALAKGHRNYFIKWVDSAKTIETRTKRIVVMINALTRNMGFSEMIRESTGKINK